MSDGYKIKNQNRLHFLTMTIVGWIDVFAYLEFKNLIIDNLKYCQANKGLNIFAYVIMTNHIHIICQTDEKSGLSALIRDFKSYTAKEIIKKINSENNSRANWILSNFAYQSRFNARNDVYQVWQHDNHPIELVSPVFIRQKLSYIHLNPVRAGIVDEPSHYIHSSARNYENLNGLIDVTLLDLGTDIGYIDV
ncbi:MAG: transposase [Chitinophagales bacterium]|nr:transposase [Chitinophagales bacterium]